MLTLAIRWGWRPDNPVRGIERNQEQKRHRYFSGDELARLTAALTTHDDRQAASIVRLLLLTGARRGEALQARWDELDLKVGVWTKPGATTKQKTEHRVPLSAPARQLLSELRAAAEMEREKAGQPISDFVFPSRGDTGHRVEIKKDWRALCKVASIHGARLHDCRHTFASVLASAGLSLPIIGALLGHSNPSTTARYSHLMDDPLRAATERAGAIMSGKPSTEIIPMEVVTSA
jgi:integrase